MIIEGVEQTTIVFALAERILNLLKESGATLEQSQSAVRSVDAMLPVAGFQSRSNVTVRLRA